MVDPFRRKGETLDAYRKRASEVRNSSPCSTPRDLSISGCRVCLTGHEKIMKALYLPSEVDLDSPAHLTFLPLGPFNLESYLGRGYVCTSTAFF